MASLPKAFLAILLALPAAAQEPVPLPRAHSHNDYERGRPLLDALERGFCSVEADIHLKDGELRVGHTGGSTKPGVTLQKLYLDPLLSRVRANGGRVYRGGPEFTLLIDVKSDGKQTYLALREVLKDYSEMLTEFTPDETRPKAVAVILSGHREDELLAGEPLRYAAIDGGLDRADSGAKTLYPLVSANWRSQFSWRGEGPMDPVEKARLARILSKAHARGRRVRFWGIPDRQEGWRMLHDSGVDLINTDELEGLMRFLLGRWRRLRLEADALRSYLKNLPERMSRQARQSGLTPAP